MPATENLKFEVELKMSGSADFVKQLKTQLENVNASVKAVENSLNKGLGVSLDDLINKAKQLSKTLGGIDSSKSVSGSGSANGVKMDMDLTPLITVLTRLETQLNSTMLSVKGSLQQSVQNSASVLEQVKLIRTKLYEIGSKFGVSAVSAGAISPSAIPVSPDGKGGKESINVTCKCDCGNGQNPPKPNQPNNPPPPNGLEEVSGYLAAYSAAVSAIGVYSAYAYDKTVDLKESLYAVTLSASQTQSALETVSQQQIISGYTTDQLKDATILLERMGASAKRYLPIAVNVAQKTGNKLAVVAEDLAGALDSLEALEAFQSKYKISDLDLKRNGAKFDKKGKLAYTTSEEKDAAGEVLSKTLEYSFSNYNNVNTYGEAVNSLQNSVETLASKVGEQLLPAFVSVVDAGNVFVNFVGSLDSRLICLVSSTTAFAGVLSGIIPVITKLGTSFKALPAALAALGPYSGIIAATSIIAGTVVYAANSQIQEEQAKQKQLKEEADAYYNLKHAAEDYLNTLKEINEENKDQNPHQLYGDRIANNPKKIEELENTISKAEEQKKFAIEEAKKQVPELFKDENIKDEDVISALETALEDVTARITQKQLNIVPIEDFNAGGRLYSTPPNAMPQIKRFDYDQNDEEEAKLLENKNQLRSFIQSYKNAMTVVSNASEDLRIAKKDNDAYSVFKSQLSGYKEQLSVIKAHGGEDSYLQVRETVTEAIKELREQLAITYGHYFGGKDAKANLQDRNFVFQKLLEFAKKGDQDTYQYKMLSALDELYKEKAATYPKAKEKDLETVLRELKESEGWQSSEETKQKRSGFTAKDRIDPEKQKDLGKQLEQASRDNRAYLQTHKEDLEKFSQAMDAWADKQMDIWETWAQAQLKGHDAAWAKTPEQRLDVSKQTLHYYSELLKSHKDLLSQNEKLNDRLTNAIKEQAEAYSQALQERFEKESAGKTEDEILKAARRNLQSARSAKDLPEDMRDQEINKWKGQIQEALDSIKEKREEQQERLRSMEAEKQNKQLEELEKRREKGEDVWPQMLALMRQMAAAEIEQVKLAEQKEIDALPEDLRDTQRELAEWHIAQTRDKWQQQILEAYKRGNTKDTKDLDKRRKDIDQAAAAKNAKEDEAVKRERERLTKPATFGSYDEIKQYKDNQRLEALQKKADERKAKNTEQAALDKQKLEQEALQKELDSEKALTESLGSLDASVKALTSAMSAQSAYSKGGEGSSILKDGKKETAGADGGAAPSAEDVKPEAAVSEKLKAALPYASAVYSRAGEIYLATGREPVINPRMVEPLLRAQDLRDRMARQVSSTVNNSTTSSTLQNFYIDGSKNANDPDLRSLADSVSKILERRERRQRAYSGMW